MKKSFLILFLALILAMVPFSAGAQTTNEQLETLVARLQEALVVLQARVSNQSSGGPYYFCHNFNTNLGRDSSGSEVVALQRALKNNGVYNLPTSALHGRYDTATMEAVSAFQTKYADEILVPAGLSTATGYVGRSTRQKLNQLSGCQIEPVRDLERPDLLYPFVRSTPDLNQSPIIVRISGPTTLAVGQTSTWTVVASDPEGDPLAYYVIWGDETTLGTAGNAVFHSAPYAPVATFTHAYREAGVYTPRFLVKDSSGGNTETSLNVSVLTGWFY